jgi:hypothetical protein
VNRFAAHANDALNMPRATALTWELVKSNLAVPAKKATLCEFDAENLLIDANKSIINFSASTTKVITTSHQNLCGGLLFAGAR